MSARIPYGVSPSTMATIRMTMPYRLSMRLLKKSAWSTSLSRNLIYATPRMAEKMTTAMVEVDRAPARSAKGFVGMNERISCGSVRLAASLCWEASDESSAASGVAASRKPACAKMCIRDRCIKFPRHGDVNVVDHVSFVVRPRQTMGLVGESGCGKSITSLTIMGLLDPKAKVSGEILYDGQNLLNMDQKQMNALRGREIAMIYQDALS